MLRSALLRLRDRRLWRLRQLPAEYLRYLPGFGTMLCLLVLLHRLGMRRAGCELARAKVLPLHQFLRTGRLLRSARYAWSWSVSSCPHAARFRPAAVTRAFIAASVRRGQHDKLGRLFVPDL